MFDAAEAETSSARDCSTNTTQHRSGAGCPVEGESNPGGPVYDPFTVCGYHQAGWCNYGSRCKLQHNAEYALALRDQWLTPNESTNMALMEAAERMAGADAVAAAELFPRVLARPVVLDEAHASSTDTGGGASYFVVLDLEGKDEMTEFPALLFDVAAGHEIGRFQRAVLPHAAAGGEWTWPDHRNQSRLCGCPSRRFYGSEGGWPAGSFVSVVNEFQGWLCTVLGREDPQTDLEDVVVVTCGHFDCKHIHRHCDKVLLSPNEQFLAARW